MTEDEAEQILMAVEVDLFRGNRGELAQAIFVIANRDAKDAREPLREVEDG